jgi:hypothetical protein
VLLYVFAPFHSLAETRSLAEAVVGTIFVHEGLRFFIVDNWLESTAYFFLLNSFFLKSFFLLEFCLLPLGLRLMEIADSFFRIWFLNSSNFFKHVLFVIDLRLERCSSMVFRIFFEFPSCYLYLDIFLVLLSLAEYILISIL